MKQASPTAVAGRRLRRYLGALLAIGFGASWWSFIPPARAAATIPRMAPACLPKPFSIEPVVRPLANAIDQIGEALMPHAGVASKPKRNAPKRRPIARLPPPQPHDITPVLTDEPIYIRTRSS